MKEFSAENVTFHVVFTTFFNYEAHQAAWHDGLLTSFHQSLNASLYLRTSMALGMEINVINHRP